MTNEELRQLEKLFGLELPDEYKQLVVSHPLPNSGSYDYELCGDYESLVVENKSVREIGFFGEPWNDTWFVIGMDGCGNNHFITTLPFDGRVYFADHEGAFHSESLRQNEHHASLAAFVASLEESEEDIRQDEEKMKEKIRNRKWWQFWIPKSP